MQIRALESLKKILSDRLVTASIVAVILLAAAYMIYVAVSLQPSELQVATHYTVFGETNFYRNKWYYLISFILFGLLTLAANLAIVVKLFFYELRGFAIAFACLTLLIITAAWFISHSVLNIAFLS